MTPANQIGDLLVTAQQVHTDELPPVLRGYRSALRSVVDWAWRYLSRPHPALGRRGHVCPYTRLSLTTSRFHLAVRPGRPSGPAEVTALLERYRDRFGELEPTQPPDNQYKTILVLFPDVLRPHWSALIDASQRLLKPGYVARGLMIGEFHNGPPRAAGLWNADFRPLRSPVPLLAIRHMVPTDLAFLESEPQYLAAYLDRFGDAVPAALRPRLERARAALDPNGAGHDQP